MERINQNREVRNKKEVSETWLISCIKFFRKLSDEDILSKLKTFDGEKLDGLIEFIPKYQKFMVGARVDEAFHYDLGRILTLTKLEMESRRLSEIEKQAADFFHLSPLKYKLLFSRVLSDVDNETFLGLMQEVFHAMTGPGIKKTYRTYVTKWHSDKSANEGDTVVNEEKIKLINILYREYQRRFAKK